MSIKIGGREHITTAALLVPEGEDAWVEFLAGTWNVRIHVVFKDDPANATPSFSLAAEEDHAVLSIINWKTPLPSATIKPFALGQTDGKTIVVLFSGYAVDGLKRIELSFFWEKHDA